MASSDSESLGPMTSDRRRPQLQARTSSPIKEKGNRKRRRLHRSGIAVLEGQKPIIAPIDLTLPADREEGDEGPIKRGRPSCLQQSEKDSAATFEQAAAKLEAGLAEDYFLSGNHTKLNRSLTATVASPGPAAIEAEQLSHSDKFASWVKLLRHGFSLLLHGVGSKRTLLQDFAKEALKPEGVVVVQLDVFNARFSLCEALKDLLCQVYPNATRQGASSAALGATVRAAAGVPGARPLVLVVHNLELMPQSHLVILSSLAAAPGVHLVASVDSVWASLAWDSLEKDFNFYHVQTDTQVSYKYEVAARYPRGLPPWSGLGHEKHCTPKASLSLVLRSLTNNHRELVQAMAERQLQGDSQTGISLSGLLKISTDRMIAHTVPKLRTLLNELQNHEVVVQRGCSSVATAQALFFYLPFDERTLVRLTEGKALDSDDEGEAVAPVGPGDAAGDEEEVVAAVTTGSS